MHRSFRRSWWAFGLALLFLSCSPWAPLPVHAASNQGKLRVFVQPLSSPLSGGKFYQTTDMQFASSQFAMTERILRQTGIYEVIPPAEVRSALKGGSHAWWRWERSDWTLLREVGKGLGADYALVAERGIQGDFYIRMVLINLDTGRRYDVRDQVPGRAPQEGYHRMWRELYRKLFAEAKGDMLATALRKGRALAVAPAAQPIPSDPPALSELPELTEPPTEGPEPAVSAVTKAPQPEASPLPPPPPGQEPAELCPLPEKAQEPAAPAAAVPPPPAPRPARVTQPAGPPAPGRPVGEKARVIVYDFDAGTDLQVAGIILAEALREELYRLGRVTLINREEMVRAAEEHKLKMVGLLEEEGSAQIGKWLMAGEMVTGKLGRLGGTSILQTKRTDIESLGVRNIQSLKSPSGREEELLAEIPDLARRLFAGP